MFKKKKEKNRINKKGREFFISSLAVICFLVLFAGVGMASATNYYVATEGSDSNVGTSLDHPWQHPSYAAQQAQAGDTIYLLDGTWYNEHLVFANSGTETHPITLKAYSGTPTFDGVDKRGIGITIHDKSYLSLSGFLLRNYENGIDGEGLCRHISISDFTIEDTDAAGICLTGASIQNSEITDFTIQRTGGSAIYRTGSSDCFDITISDFIINDVQVTPEMSGVFWEKVDGLHILHGEIHNAFHGIQLQKSIDNAIIDDVKVYGADFHGICITDPTQEYYPCYDNIIRNCYVAYTRHNAIDLHSGAYNTLVENCELTGDGSMGAGIYFHDGGKGLVVRDCTIYGESFSEQGGFKGIELTSRSDVLVEGCTLYNLRRSIEGHGGDYTIRNNVIHSIVWPDTIKVGEDNIVCENNDIGGGRYRINCGHGLVRNSLGNSYSVCSEYGATITVDYTDGKTFSVDGEGSYTTYVFTSKSHSIEVLGEVSTGTIAGVVTTTTGSPIEGATVTVEGAGKSGDTDSLGTYTITDVAVGTYTVTASAPGYEDASSLAVKVNKDEITTLNFLLTVGPAQDTTPPAAVTDLATTEQGSHSITLVWTAPGDDEDTGTATKSDIRYSRSEITAANWDVAIKCTDEPTPEEAGSTETFTVTGLSPDTIYYFALKTADEVSNWSDISNSASGTTTEVVVELASYWKFDEGSGNTAQDSSGNNNAGTIQGASWTEGKEEKGLSFDGTNDYVNCGQDTSLKITSAITVEAWVKWTGDGNPSFVTKTGGSGRRSYDLSGNDDGTVEFRVGGADCSTSKSSGTAPIARGEWVYLVGTYEPSNYVRVFVNGALAEEETTSIPAAQGDNGLPWYIGAREGNQGWFNGDIDEVKIHNGALSAEEIRANYDANPTNNPPAAIIDSITPETAEQGKDTVSFSGHGTDTDGLVVAYNWRSSRDGQLSTASSYRKPASELSVGTHTIYFKVQDDNGAWSIEVTEELGINQEPENIPPVADPKGPYTDTEGVSISFDGSTSLDPDGSIESYLWDFGGENTSSEVTPAHTYAGDGTYTVTLTVTDNEGATSTSTTTATIADTEPTAVFSATPTCGDGPLTVTFTDNSASYDGIEAWEWDFNNDDVTDSTARNPTYVYIEDGVYTVSLKVYESDGDCDVMTKANYISVTGVNNAPYAPDNPSPSEGATEVSIDEALSWTGGDSDADDTVTYEVYFGTSITPLLVAEDQLETTYEPGTLDHSTEYYWRIVATDNHGASKVSEVWSFVTDSAPDPDLVAEWDLDEGSGVTAVDSSGNGNDGTLVNNPTWVTGKVGKGLSFDGTNDYVDCGQDTGLKITGAITVEAWVKWSGDGNPSFVTKTGRSGRRSYDLSGNDDGTVEFRVGGADCSTSESSGTAPIPRGEWVYLVGTYEPSSYVRVFVNGALAEEETASIPAAQGDNGLSWYIGAREGNQDWFNGDIDEVKIHNGALSAEEIRANYEANPTNNPPAAIIDSITPETAEQGKDTVSFSGHGTDTDGLVVAYDWRSSRDGQLSTASSYSKPASELSVGTHTIYFRVQDDNGAWSTEVTEELTIIEQANQHPFTPAEPSPSDGATEVSIEGALSWTGGDSDADDTVTYEVYFGTSITPLLVAEDQLETTYEPGTLDHSTEYYWRIVATDNHGASMVSEVWSFVTDSAPDPDLVAEWDLDEGSGVTAVDSSGNGNDGTLVNNPTWVTGKVGKGLSFDGTNDYVDCGQDTGLKITGAITVEAWVKWSGDGNPSFVTKTGRSGRRSYDLSGNDDGTVEFRVGGADCSTSESSGTAPIPRGEWVYLVGTYEPSNYVRVFVNGALAEEETASIPAAQGDNGLSWYIGAREGNQDWFNGDIDKVKIHNGALSAEEIRANYEAYPRNQPPVADPIGTYTGIEGVALTFDGSTSSDPDGSIESYLWDFGDGNTVTELTPTHTYAQDGEYTVTLTVTDSEGATDTYTTTATIADTEPGADFFATPTGGSGPLTVDFSSNSASYDGIEAWEWDFDNDGEIDSTEQNPTHVYTEGGVYTVSLTVYESDGGCDTMTKADYIEVAREKMKMKRNP